MKIFIGYDPRESVSYHVAVHSILKRSSIPVDITPLALVNLTGIFERDRNALQSTDFSFTRFLVPDLSDFRGWSLFMDCDTLVRTDISEILKACEWHKSVYVVKHDYTPKDETKFLGAKQTKYPKKNWSSVMLFNNTRCRKLTREYVNSASGLDLHQFKWVKDETEIGELSKDWNHLVGEYPHNPEAKIVHFTRGGPWFREYKDCEFSKEWFDEHESMSQPMKGLS